MYHIDVGVKMNDNEELEMITCKIDMPNGVLMIELTKDGFDLLMRSGEYLFDKEKNMLHYVGKQQD